MTTTDEISTIDGHTMPKENGQDNDAGDQPHEPGIWDGRTEREINQLDIKLAHSNASNALRVRRST